MADHRDDVDAWLSERINPLPPPPGTFDLIKRRARRRKIRRLAITAASAAVIVAAAVTVPEVVNLPVLNTSPTSAAEAGHPATATPTGAGRAESSASAPRPSAASLPAPVPPDFRPTSVTFIGPGTGWVIGQAGTPGHCATPYCTSMARTDNAGRTWAGVPAPLTGAPAGATGVSQVRFLNLNDGWAFGPELWVTHTGGQTWTQVYTHGLRVTDLETVGSRAFALFASCTGSGQAFAARCTSFTLYSSPAAGNDFTPVGAATTGRTDGAATEAASLVLTASRGYELAPDGTLYAGPVDGSGAWSRAGALVSSCTVGSAQPDGQPWQALLGAVNAKELLVACTSSAGSGSHTQDKQVFSSLNGGVSWIQIATAPTAGIAFSLAASHSEAVVLGTDRGIDLLRRGDIAWQTATLAGGGPAGSGPAGSGPAGSGPAGSGPAGSGPAGSGPAGSGPAGSGPAGSGPAGGFGYVGMTGGAQGVALPADPSAGTVWFTFDGGQTWKPSPLNGA
jgi:hypothetical protein